jgi:hypothetical protein
MERIAIASPRLKAGLAGVSYLLAILAGVLAEFVSTRWSFAAHVTAILCNIAVALLFYDLFKPVNRSLSALAAFFGLATSAMGVLSWHPRGVDIGLIFFGFYCLLIGYLIFRSTFLPRILGVLMAFAGLAWLTFLSRPLANQLSPYNLAAGILGQGSLTLWLLVVGVNVPRWKERASPTGRGRS